MYQQIKSIHLRITESSWILEKYIRGIVAIFQNTYACWTNIFLVFLFAGDAQVISRGQVEYKIRFGIRYMWWYHLVGLIWTSEFILACQQMTVAGAVVTCFFNRYVSSQLEFLISSDLFSLEMYVFCVFGLQL